MSLQEAVDKRAFQPTPDLEELARSHAWFDRLAGAPLERRLATALTDQEQPRAVAVIGRTGAGKTSLIMSVTADMPRIGVPKCETLIVRAGDAESVLGGPGEFAQHILQTIRSQGFRFADEVQDQLRAIGADETTETEPVTTHTGSVTGGPPVVQVGYQHSLQEAFAQRRYSQSPANAREELKDVLEIIRADEAWPVVVIDDTDRFVDAHGEIANTTAVGNLFQNGVRLLAEVGLPHVVAVHPRFLDDDSYIRAKDRLGIVELEIPFLRVDCERNPPAQILEKHLQAHEIETGAAEIIDPEPLAALWGAYTPGRDLRRFMRATDTAARIAVGDSKERIDQTSVSDALEKMSAND